MDLERTLKLVSRAWGRQQGFSFFPWIDGDCEDRDARRRAFHEGPAFEWPQDREKILAHLEQHVEDDAYWCPSLFEEPRRQMELAMDEHCLWADLDEVDPKAIEDFPPSMAWETSPGRYQALWLLVPGTGDLQGASWRGGENQRMTYHLGADSGGWDTTNLLRLPGWRNHKPEHRERWGKEGAPGKLLWATGRTYQPDDFGDLPEVGSIGIQVETALIDQVDTVDAAEAWGKVRLKVGKAVRELVAARQVAGDRSEVLWRIERDLADAGLTVPEIVAVVRETAWNKFAGRDDELRRLTLEAAKAVDARPEKVTRGLEDEREVRRRPEPLATLVRGVKQPSWLVRRIWTEGAVGFVAGQPKSYKSWFALDLALSVATGAPFLGTFQVVRPGPTLYVQEEDSLPTLKRRWDRIRPERMGDRMEAGIGDDDEAGGGKVTWTPGATAGGTGEDPPIDALVGAGLVLSDEGWQAWLDETLTRGWTDGRGKEGADQYRLIVLDPLLMMLGDVEENRAAEVMGKVLGPLRQLARKHEVAVAVVHHMRKAGSDQRGGQGQRERGGQLMLGSVAYHAWADEALYIRRGPRGKIVADWESKSGTPSTIEVGGLTRPGWRPEAVRVRDAVEGPGMEGKGGGGPGRGARAKGAVDRENATLAALKRLETATVAQISDDAGVSRSSVHSALKRALAAGAVRKDGTRWVLNNAKGVKE